MRSPRQRGSDRSRGCASSCRGCRARRCTCRPCRTFELAHVQPTPSISTPCSSEAGRRLLRTGRQKSWRRCSAITVLVDVNSDQQQSGPQTNIVIDRATASDGSAFRSVRSKTRFTTAFGQRQVSTIYSAINQYHVVMECAPQFWQSPETLKDVFVSTAGATPSGTATTNLPAGAVSAKPSASSHPSHAVAATAGVNNSARNANTNALASSGRSNTTAGAPVSTSVESMIPLAAVAHYARGTTPLSVNHQGLFVASTISFNLRPGASLSDAAAEIARAVAEIHMPATIRGTLQGTARAFQRSIGTEPFLILAALVTVYIVLGMLYESYIHPITILSTLPSAGVGAVLALIRVQDRVQHRRADRRDFADRRRQEERNPDDRFCD